VPTADPEPSADDAGPTVAVEFLIEPFTEGTPGQHVKAAMSAFTDRGIAVELGPFASTAIGDLSQITDAISEAMQRAITAGATSMRVQLAHRLTGQNIHRALPEMLANLEQEHGPLDQWDRTTKQAAVRQLSKRGAFLLRGAIDDVATAMGVSRITIYNYLNALEDQ